MEFPKEAARSEKAPAAFPEMCAHCVGRPDCPLGSLSERCEQRLLSNVKERHFHRHEHLAVQDQHAQTFRVIKVGQVILHRRGMDGVRRPIAVLGRGSTLGKHGLIGDPDFFDAVAASNGRICEIPAKVALALKDDCDDFEDKLYRSHLQGMAQMVEWAGITRMPVVADRVVMALLLFGKMQNSQRVRIPSLAELGALVNSSRETVTRILGKLETKQRLTRTDRWHLDISALRNINA